MISLLNKKTFIIISIILLIINRTIYNEYNFYVWFLGTIILFLLLMEFIFDGVLDSELSIICLITLVSIIILFINFYGCYWDLLFILILIIAYLIFRIFKFMNYKDLYRKVE